MNLEEFKAFVNKINDERVSFVMEEDGGANAYVGEGISKRLVGSFTPHGRVWFSGKDLVRTEA